MKTLQFLQHMALYNLKQARISGREQAQSDNLWAPKSITNPKFCSLEADLQSASAARQVTDEQADVWIYREVFSWVGLRSKLDQKGMRIYFSRRKETLILINKSKSSLKRWFRDGAVDVWSEYCRFDSSVARQCILGQHTKPHLPGGYRMASAFGSWVWHQCVNVCLHRWMTPWL